ncbi:MAG: hypothetical protein COC04_00060 [Gammaproteobacteria bacterium]|nr:MAG: hypothetical protein COC04_00060 [Gammaproteobacteria bacterium]
MRPRHKIDIDWGTMMTLIEQQRLMGAVLLLLIISVISYFLISGTNTGVTKAEPTQMELSFTSVVQPLAEDDVEVVEYADETLLDPQNLGAIANTPEMTIDVEPIVESAKMSDPAPTANSTDLATPKWILQLASFSVKTNAEALAEQLSTLGYKPSVESTATGNGMIYRVRLAPMKNKTMADNLAIELAKKLNLKPQVLQQKS